MLEAGLHTLLGNVSAIQQIFQSKLEQNQCAMSTALSSEREYFLRRGAHPFFAGGSCKIITLLNLENRNLMVNTIVIYW